MSGTLVGVGSTVVNKIKGRVSGERVHSSHCAYTVLIIWRRLVVLL